MHIKQPTSMYLGSNFLMRPWINSYCDGFPQGITVTSENSVGARQPSDCTTVGDHFYGKCWQLVSRKLERKQASPTIEGLLRCVFSMGFLFGPCRGYISRPTKPPWPSVATWPEFSYLVILLVAVSSAHCICETLLKTVLYLEGVNWLCVIGMAILYLW
jgi:hypothetical protein